MNGPRDPKVTKKRNHRPCSRRDEGGGEAAKETKETMKKSVARLDGQRRCPAPVTESASGICIFVFFFSIASFLIKAT